MNDKKIEYKVPVELRMVQNEDEKQSRTVEGYAATFGTYAEFYSFRETIKRGAFTEALKNSDCRALFNHDNNQLLAREKSGTLELWEDDKGLGFRFDIPSTRDDIVEMVKRGDIDECSFAFTIKRQTWTFSDSAEEKDERMIEEVDKLYDVSIVTYPAYPNTSVSLRNKDYEAAKKEYEESKLSQNWNKAKRERSLRLLELSNN